VATSTSAPGSSRAPAPPNSPSGEADAQRRARRGRLYRLDIKLSPYIFISPFFLLFAAFGIFPLIWTGWMSLHSVSTLDPTKMTNFGFSNYTTLWHDDTFWTALRNTFTIGIISTVPQLLMAIGFAHLLNYQLRGRSFFRVALLAPYATSVAAAALIFQYVFQSDDSGFINWGLHLFGVHAIDWQSNTVASQVAVSAIVIWRWTGYNALIYLAAMQAIPGELYEAAAIDGANRWQQFRNVTVPALRPTILFTVIISTMGSLQLFGEPKLYGEGNTGLNGGAAGQFNTLALYLYRTAFGNEHLGQAAAIAWVIFLLAVIIGAVNALVARRLRKSS
jgi:cellobiose transport system permease protein